MVTNNETKNQDWETMPFAECLEKVSFGREKQVKLKDYLKTGLYPIVDQGQSFIAGYTDDESKVIDSIQPFIIFGDHTRILKYINIPIALGADGTKVIKPKKDFDTSFLYYYLKNLNIPSRGYNRHYLFLKEKTIAKPELPEQKAIARVLNTAQNAIAGQEELIEKLKKLKKSMMQYLFTHGTKNELMKMTEIGEIPKCWEVVELGNICERKNEQYQPSREGNKKYVGLEHILSGELQIRNHGNETSVKSSKVVFERGDILYGKLRPYLDKASISDFDGVASTDILVLRGLKVSNRFLSLLLHTEKFLNFANETTSGVNHPRTSWMSLSKYKLAMPDCKSQQVIEQTGWLINQKIESAQAKLSAYQKLFKTLLHELMSGERRAI